MTRVRSFWGWGYEGEGLSADEADAVAALAAARIGAADLHRYAEPSAAALDLPRPRVEPPEALAAIFSAEPVERAGHAYGKAYRDVVRHLRGEYPHPPDLVALPADEADVERVLAWCEEARVACIPYGGGSSVTGGVEPELPDGYRGAVSLDLRRLGRMLELDRESRAAHLQAGMLGPDVEDALRPEGLTLRHFPQSYEVSTVGGWIATRSGGHHSTLRQHIDEFVESVRLLTPRGLLETRRLPASGAGPDPNRLVLGSEGTLGVITSAWLRVQPRPDVRSRGSARFATFEAGAAAARAVAQSGLYPSECRLLDALEAELNGAGTGTVLLLGFEAAGRAQELLDLQLSEALQLCREGGATAVEKTPAAASGWRSSFVRAPYLRDALAVRGLVAETFETACTWSAFPGLYEAVLESVPRAWATCRLTHVYPDGPAPYFTIVCAARPGSEVETWDDIKSAASEAVLGAGGTITHHHSVGRVHRSWYAREATPILVRTLRAARFELDPAGIMNPGCLLPD